MRVFVCSAIIAGLAFMAFAGDDFDKLDALKEKRAALALKMHKKRVEMIKSDPSLMELQKKIIALEKELAIRIDNNPEMRKMIDELAELDREIKNAGGGGD